MNKSELKFPVTYDLKVIMESGNDEENQAAIKKVLDDLKIPNSNWDIKDSSLGNYKRYSVKIIVISKKRMEELYNVMPKIPKVKNVL